MAKCIYLSRPVRVADTLVSETGEEIYLVVAMAKATNQYRLTKSLREVSDDVWNAKVENFNAPAYPLEDKEPCKLPEFFRVGAIIKSFGCNGVVTTVYTSESTGNQAATVWFIKNIFKKQEPETELAEVFETAEESTTYAASSELNEMIDASRVEFDRWVTFTAPRCGMPLASDLEKIAELLGL